MQKRGHECTRMHMRMHTHAHTRIRTRTPTHELTDTHTGSNLDSDVGTSKISMWVPTKVSEYKPWTGARKQIEKNAAAKHNDGLAGRIFQQVVRRKGGRLERRKYTLDTLRWYVRVYFQCDLEVNANTAHLARAKIRECYKRGANTIERERCVEAESEMYNTDREDEKDATAT
jgi:hypothetical protein